MDKKLLNILLLTVFLSKNSNYNLLLSKNIKKINNTKNFTHEYSLNNKEIHQNDSGYYYYSCNVYSFNFTSSEYVKSKIFMVCTDVNFTPGSIAYQNDSKSFDQGYGLSAGYIHVNFKNYEREELQARTSSFDFKLSTPENSTFNSVITTSYGGKYNYSSSLGGEINLDQGIVLKSSKSSGLSLSFDKSIAISSPEPTISKQPTSGNSNELQWSYKFSSKHNNSFSFSSIIFLEVLNDAHGYSPYSFGIDISIKMENYKVGFFWIPNTKVTQNSSNIVIGSLL